MSDYVLPSDGEPAWTFAQRWNRCSERARKFAAWYGGRFAPLLPHVVAEQFDKGEIDERAVYASRAGGELGNA